MRDKPRYPLDVNGDIDIGIVDSSGNDGPTKHPKQSNSRKTDMEIIYFAEHLNLMVQIHYTDNVKLEKQVQPIN